MQPAVLRDESVLLGLGAMVDMEGYIPDEGAAAAIEALADYVEAAEEEGAESITLLATEPLRRASNRTRFCEAVEEATGLPAARAQPRRGGPADGPRRARWRARRRAPAGARHRRRLIGDRAAGARGRPGRRGHPRGLGAADRPARRGRPAHRRRGRWSLRAEAHHLFSSLPTGHPQARHRGRRLRHQPHPPDHATRATRTTAIAGFIDTAPHRARHRDRDGRASAELVETYGLRERRILQMAAGASLIEAALDCYNLEVMEASDASLREGVIIAREEAGDAWREELVALVSGD